MPLFSHLKGDLYGGVTAAVVALPLALAFGVASGVGPLAGLWGAILVGFFASVFGGTPSQVSGPTGPMTVVMAGVVMQYAHEPALAFGVVVLGGLLQILFGILRLGSLISLVPYTVISGFMSGIGCIIMILQLSPLLGQSIPPGGPLGALLALPQTLSAINIDAFVVGGLAFGIMVAWPKKLNRIVPAPLLALFVGTLVVYFFLSDAPVIGDIPTGFPEFRIPSLDYFALKDMLGSALILALLGSIDSLLTSLIADSLSNTRHNSNKELIGQGIGNAIAGLFGGIPGAGATMRTVINIRAGGVTPVSGVIHSLVLAAIVLGLGPLAENIPHAVLAGILMKVGWDIIDWEYIKLLRSAPRKGVIHMLMVLVLTVFVDLIVAVATGLVVASLTFVKHMSDLQVKSIKRHSAKAAENSDVSFTPTEQVLLEELGDNLLLYRFDGPMSFGAAKGIFALLTDNVDAELVLLDFSGATYIDTTAALAVRDTLDAMAGVGRRVLVCEVAPNIKRVLDGLRVLDRLSPNDLILSREGALQKLIEENAHTPRC